MLSINQKVSLPKFSVIIPVYNDVHRVKACIDSLHAQKLSQDEYEVIVVDNGSSDGTYELLKTLSGFTLLQCFTPGSYAARNMGLEIAKGDYVAFTDSDCIVSESWLNELQHTALGSQGDVIIAGKMQFFSDDSKKTEQSALDFENLFSMKQEENAANGKCITANFYCSLQLLKKFNGFNQKLKSGGDIELSNKVVKGGGRIIYSANALVLHPSRNIDELIIKRKRIIGGTWDSGLSTRGSKAIGSFAWRVIKMFVGRSYKVLFTSQFSLVRRFKLIFLLFLIMFTSFSELIKLIWGKEANRS